MLLDDPDPLFTAFLTAGSARVVIPVRPGFEKAMSYYLATNRIWGRGPVPTVKDPLYISIANEIQAQQQVDPTGVAEGGPWEVRLPTTLVILEKDGELPKFQP